MKIAHGTQTGCVVFRNQHQLGGLSSVCPFAKTQRPMSGTGVCIAKPGVDEWAVPVTRAFVMYMDNFQRTGQK